MPPPVACEAARRFVSPASIPSISPQFASYNYASRLFRPEMSQEGMADHPAISFFEIIGGLAGLLSLGIFTGSACTPTPPPFWCLEPENREASYRLTSSEAEALCKITDKKDLRKTEREYLLCAERMERLGRHATERTLLTSLIKNGSDAHIRNMGESDRKLFEWQERMCPPSTGYRNDVFDAKFNHRE